MAGKPDRVAMAANEPEAAECRRADALMVQSARCRRLAENIGDPATAATLLAMAQEYEAQATTCRG